ncbi:hypothetical protein CC86DRAFT_12738 [Ophiobolus disseminans]|uniref:Uncharacterized protein n=1 Tax=Ophiobolus disseminans TaxID=1469910 RepID=A0A6A7AKZ0_9PLEO|nr:hypothetical protein CC86DRAFT_12738 [Ophiobolus disseminans]
MRPAPPRSLIRCLTVIRRAPSPTCSLLLVCNSLRHAKVSLSFTPSGTGFQFSTRQHLWGKFTTIVNNDAYFPFQAPTHSTRSTHSTRNSHAI